MKLAGHLFQLPAAAVGLDEVLWRALDRHEHALAYARSSRELLSNTHRIAVVVVVVVVVGGGGGDSRIGGKGRAIQLW